MSRLSIPGANCCRWRRPGQFNLTTGVPGVRINLIDGALYGEDDWHVRPNFTLSYGLRFEAQNDINDHADPAPRFGLAWGLGRRSKVLWIPNVMVRPTAENTSVGDLRAPATLEEALLHFDEA